MTPFNLRASALLAALFSVGALAVGPVTATAALPKAAVVAGYDDLAPFSIRLDILFANGYGSATFAVPAGQRLVIDYVSADFGVASGAAVLFDLATISNGSEVESHLPATPQGTLLGQSVFALSAPVRIYADAGSTVTVAILTSSPTGGAIVGIYGHFVPSS